MNKYINAWKNKGKENVTSRWWFRWWSDWAKRCYPIKILWWLTEFIFIDLFFIYIFTIPHFNWIMQDPIMKIIPFNDQSWKIITESFWSIPWSNSRMWFCRMDDLSFEMKSSETNTNSGKSTWGSKSQFRFKNWVQIKEFNFTFFSINEMWLSKRGGLISNFMDTRINVGSRNRSKLGKDAGVNIDKKIWIESQSCGLGSHSYSSSISLKWKLVNLSKG